MDQPEIAWIDAAETLWDVPVLDVRAVTQAMIATSSDPQCAANALSYADDDGSAFAADEPASPRVIGTLMRFRVTAPLADGALFRPQCMEHKWAIFHHTGSPDRAGFARSGVEHTGSPDRAGFARSGVEHTGSPDRAGFARSGVESHILFVRGWTRKLHVVAELSQREGLVKITRIHGVFTDPEEHPLFTSMFLDFLLRSHALGLVYPAPLPADLAESPMEAALWCFQMFGDHALCATHHILPFVQPEQPLEIVK